MSHRLLVTGFMAAFGLSLLASSAVAQQAPGRGFGGPGGFGGFGGPGGFGQRGADPFNLLANPAIRTELELEEDQISELREVREEMEKELAEARKQLAAKYEKRLEKVLLPHQMERANQIRAQLGGLNDDWVAQQLKITDAQKQELAKVNEEFGQKMRDAFQGGRPDRDALQRVQQERRDAVEGVLTSAQKEQWKKLQGAEFDRSQMFQGFGRDGDGEGGRGRFRGRPGGQRGSNE